MSFAHRSATIILTLVLVGSAVSMGGIAGGIAAEPVNSEPAVDDTIYAQSQDITSPDCEVVSYDGNGTTDDPYLITSVDQLQCIENDQRAAPGYDDNYRLTTDIDASGTTVWNGGDGFNPIGSGGYGSQFSGTFNGDGHAISGLTVSRTFANGGLFADSAGTIKNLKLRGIDIDASSDTGTIVGNNEGTITNVSASGTISGPDRVGGVVGNNDGTISQSNSSVTVRSDAINANNHGGLVGWNEGDIRNSYATGDVGTEDTERVGALVGGMDDGGTVSLSYAVGSVSGDSNAGGLIGVSDGTTFSSYWDVNATGQDFSPGSGTTGLTTDEMTGENAKESMSLDFSSSGVWRTQSGEYPQFKWQVNTEQPATPTPNVTVSTDSTNSPVTEGEELSVAATIENTGDATGTQSISLSVGDTQRDSTTVTVNSGESTAVNLSWATESGDAGNYTATVASDNDSSSTSVSVLSPSNVVVSTGSTNSPVAQGEILAVTTTVANAGDVSATQNISLSVDDAQRDSTTVTLDADETTQLTLEWETQSGDAGDYAATVRSDSDSTSTGVTVLSPPKLTVSVASTNSPVTGGETLDVAATITNAGDTSATQNVSLSVDDIQRDSTSVELDGGETTQATLEWDTQTGDVGDRTITVASESDTASISATVLAEEGLSASFEANRTTVPVEDAIRFNASASNNPDGQITDYRWDLNGDGVTDATGQSVIHVFNATGNYTIELTVIDDSVSTDTTSQKVRVTSESDETDLVNVTDGPSTVAPDNTFEINYTVENTDSQTAAYTLNINGLPPGLTVKRFDGDIQASSPEASPPTTSTTAMSPGDTATITVTYRAEAGLSGDKSIEAEAIEPLGGTNDTVASVVTVEQPAAHSITVGDAPSTVVQDTKFDITYTVENTAGRSTAYTLEADTLPSGTTVRSFSGDIESSSPDASLPTATTDAIAAGGTGSVTVTYQAAADATGNKTIGLTAEDPIKETDDSTSIILTAVETPSNPQERALQIAGVSNTLELTQSDITIAITQFSRGQTTNGLTIKQNDVTALITLFERD